MNMKSGCSNILVGTNCNPNLKLPDHNQNRKLLITLMGGGKEYVFLAANENELG